MPDQDAFEIREATSSDADTIARFVTAMAAETEGIELDAGSVREAIAIALPDPDRARYWLATAGGQVVGQFMITREWSDWNNAWYWWIQSVYVEPDWRRSGVFRALYEHVAALARERGDVLRATPVCAERQRGRSAHLRGAGHGRAGVGRLRAASAGGVRRAMPDTVTVGMMKVVPVKWEPEENLVTLERLVLEIAAAGAEIIITPEAFLDGYVIHQEDWTPERMTAVCEPGPDGPRARRIRQMAAEAQVHLVAGLSEQRGEEFYNTCYLIGPDGELIGSYDKLQVNPRYSYGRRLPVFETPWGTVGMMICADRRWPEIPRTLRLRGARIILTPTYGMKGERNAMWMQTRSYENAVWICFTHPEESLITNPKGEVAAHLVGDEEYLLHTCDLMIEGGTEMLADRHPDVYGFAWERDET